MLRARHETQLQVPHHSWPPRNNAQRTLSFTLQTTQSMEPPAEDEAQQRPGETVRKSRRSGTRGIQVPPVPSRGRSRRFLQHTSTLHTTHNSRSSNTTLHFVEHSVTVPLPHTVATATLTRTPSHCISGSPYIQAGGADDPGRRGKTTNTLRRSPHPPHTPSIPLRNYSAHGRCHPAEASVRGACDGHIAINTQSGKHSAWTSRPLPRTTYNARRANPNARRARRRRVVPP
jgi:hypothetical protein